MRSWWLFRVAVLTQAIYWWRVQRELAHLTTGDVVRRFYLWKTSSAYRLWRERAKARRGKEGARLRSAAYEDAEGGGSEASDFHNEFCALCFTGGQLLCCDGCERAYHFSCVSPPIREVPTGDWYCAHCTAMLATSVSVRPSAENAHCNEVVVLVGDEAEASDGDTFDVEEIDEEDEDEEEEEEEEEEEDEDEDENGGSLSSKDAAAQERLPRTASSSTTDNDESDDNARGRGDGRGKRGPPPQLLTTRRQLTSPARPALALELSSSERKRKRKIEAPRRIPQQHRTATNF